MSGNLDRPGLKRIQPCQNVQQGGFPGPGRPHNGGELGAGEIHVHVIQSCDSALRIGLTINFSQTADADERI